VWIVAGRAVENHPFSCPVSSPLAVSSAKPVIFLAEMTLAAELIAVIEIDFIAFFILEEITFIRMVAVNAAE
jgi:hypothetical protein